MSETPSGNPLEPTIAPTGSTDAATIIPQALGYILYERVGIGGMGEVYRCGDDALGRDLAIKVIKSELQGIADAEERFLREARLTGSLQHPGIVPIHQLGRLADGRPYYTMKLIRGRTFADMLRDEPQGPERLPRLLAVVEKVCQAVAYAHSRGVIHRDLKPANVMVGEFGEVQVMDWGLAKELHAGAETYADLSGARPAAEDETGEWLDQSTGLSRAGAALGTLAYMPPEQAAGDWDIVDERADVFALGAILCQVLTGRPPYHGGSREDLLRRVRRGDLVEASDRLQRCGAEAALVYLCREWMAVERERRPRHASVAAQRLAAYQAEVQARLRRAEVERAEAQVQAREERKRRRLTAIVAALGLLMVLGIGGGVWWQQQQRQKADLAVSNALTQADLLAEQARANPLQTDKYGQALEAARVAEQLADSGSAEARRQAQALIARLEQEESAARKDRELLAALLDVHGPREGPKYIFDAQGTMMASAELSADEQFAAAFRRWGLDVDGVPSAEAATKLKARPAVVVTEVIAALDEWAGERRGSGKGKKAWQPLSDLAALLDEQAGSKRRELREILARGRLPWERVVDGLSRVLHPLPVPLGIPLGPDHLRLRQLAEQTDAAREPILSLLTLVRALSLAEEKALAERLLRAAIVARPREVVLHHWLGQLLTASQPPRWAEAVECHAAARTLRPDLGVNLELALRNSGREDEGLALLLRLVEESGQNPYLHFRLAHALTAKGRWDEAIDEYHKAIGLDSQYAQAHNNLGLVLSKKGRWDEAEAQWHKAVTLDPKLATARNNLGAVRANQGQFDEAMAEYHKALALNPKDATAHTNLGHVLYVSGRLDEAMAEWQKAIALNPKYAPPHTKLGGALYDKGRFDEAMAEFHKALALNPKDAQAHSNLGIALSDKGRWDDAMAEYHMAIALDPKYAKAHTNLGNALRKKGRLDEAMDEHHKAIALDPKLAPAHNNLGFALYTKGRLDEAMVEFREAIALNPKFVQAHSNLGNALFDKGRRDEAMAEFHKAIALDPKNAKAHGNLGNALYNQGRLDEAMTEYHKAISLDPKYDKAHHNLGKALYDKGRFDEALPEFREAIRLKPDFAEAHCNLGAALRQQGRFAESLASYRRGHQLGTKKPGWRYSSALWVRTAEELLRLDGKLLALFTGEATPANPGEAVALASMCQQPYKKRFADAARLYADAFAAEPKLATDLNQQHRYNAACSATLAAAGNGRDAPFLPDKVAAMFRRWALRWLREDLAAYAKIAEQTNPAVKQTIRQRLAYWRRDPDLASVRDPQALARLPAHERAAWQALWREVDKVAKR